MINAGPLEKSAATTARPARAFKLPDQLFLHILIIVILFFMLLPFIWMVGTALKPDADATPTSLSGKGKDIGTLLSLFWPREFHFENFIKAWHGKYSANVADVSFFDAPFTRYFFNTIVVGVAETVGVLFTSILAA